MAGASFYLQTLLYLTSILFKLKTGLFLSCLFKQDGDRFKKAHLQRKVPIFIEGLVIQLQPNVDKFEDKLCELMRVERALRENRTEDTTDVIIVERRLQVRPV